MIIHEKSTDIRRSSMNITDVREFLILILRATPSAAGPFLVAAVIQSCHLGGLVPPLWHPGEHFGTLGPPWGTMGAVGRTCWSPESDCFQAF